VQQFRDERDAALESYRQALDLFRATGSRLGEANTLKAIGDVQQFRDERDAALESYRQALDLFRATGSRLGEANVLVSLGGIEKDRATAQTLFEQAFITFEMIQDHYSIARTRYYFGQKLQEWGEVESAADQYRQSTETFEALGLPRTADVPWHALAQLRGETPRPLPARQAELRAGFGSLILAVTAAAGGDQAARAQVEALFEQLTQGNWQIVEAIQRVWEGERELAALTTGIDVNSAFLVSEMLAALADPEGYAAGLEGGE
jgi:tetratricopeptide (TPR) repeat protein